MYLLVYCYMMFLQCVVIVDVSFCPVQALVDVRISDSSEAEVVKISAKETEELVQVNI